MRCIKIVHAESILKLETFAIGGIACHEHVIRSKAFMENVNKHDSYSLVVAVKQGKAKCVGNEADNDKGYKHAKENEEISKHKLEAP